MRDFGHESSPSVTPATSRKTLWVSLIVVLTLAVAVILWFMYENQSQTPSQPVIDVVESHETAEPEVPVEEPAPLVQEVIPPVADTLDLDEPAPAEPEVPLPSLNESTAAVLQELVEAEQTVTPLQSEQLIRDAVVFMDNLRQGQVIREKSVIAGPTAAFRVLEQNSNVYIDPRSYDRYNTIVDWFVSLDTEVIMQLFDRYQPLMREALAEIGYPDEEPTQVLLEAIEVLMQTPAVGTVIELNDDSVMYRYADPALEALPAAQKQMLRMGPDNIRRVKLKLTTIQEALKK